MMFIDISRKYYITFAGWCFRQKVKMAAIGLLCVGTIPKFNHFFIKLVQNLTMFQKNRVRTFCAILLYRQTNTRTEAIALSPP